MRRRERVRSPDISIDDEWRWKPGSLGDAFERATSERSRQRRLPASERMVGAVADARWSGEVASPRNRGFTEWKALNMESAKERARHMNKSRSNRAIEYAAYFLLLVAGVVLVLVDQLEETNNEPRKVRCAAWQEDAMTISGSIMIGLGFIAAAVRAAIDLNPTTSTHVMG